MDGSKPVPFKNISPRIARFGPNRFTASMGPSLHARSVIAKAGPGGTHFIHDGGSTCQRGNIAPPNIEYDGFTSAASRKRTSQSGRGKTSSSVKTARSPSMCANAVFSAEFFPALVSNTYVRGSLAWNEDRICGVRSLLPLSATPSFQPPVGGCNFVNASSTAGSVFSPFRVANSTVNMIPKQARRAIRTKNNNSLIPCDLECNYAPRRNRITDNSSTGSSRNGGLRGQRN